MKRIFIFLCCSAVLMSCFFLPAFADSPDDGTVNSAALNYFTGIVNKLPPNSDYVIYRSGDYSATMIYGFNFELNGSIVSCSDVCTKLVYDARGVGSAGYYFPTFESSEASGFYLNTSNKSIIYSSLGSWPAVGDSSKDTFTYILWSIVILIFLFIVFKIFRNRRQYINL